MNFTHFIIKLLIIRLAIWTQKISWAHWESKYSLFHSEMGDHIKRCSEELILSQMRSLIQCPKWFQYGSQESAIEWHTLGSVSSCVENPIDSDDHKQKSKHELYNRMRIYTDYWWLRYVKPLTRTKLIMFFPHQWMSKKIYYNYIIIYICSTHIIRFSNLSLFPIYSQ